MLLPRPLQFVAGQFSILVAVKFPQRRRQFRSRIGLLFLRGGLLVQ